MQCLNILFSEHAVKQMFAREISINEVELALSNGETIAEYPDDKPYPSLLLLHFFDKLPVHVVVAKETEGSCIVITAYRPDRLIWESDFKTKKK